MEQNGLGYVRLLCWYRTNYSGVCRNKANISCSAKLVAFKGKYFRYLKKKKKDESRVDAACEMDTVDTFLEDR